MKLRAGMLGADQMVRTLRTLAREHPDKVGVALFEEAGIEVIEMRRRTPVDTRPDAPHPGQLRDSIHAEKPERSGRMIVVRIITPIDYAIYVHENPDAIHPIGEWKFMESVLNESQSHMAARVAERIRFR